MSASPVELAIAAAKSELALHSSYNAEQSLLISQTIPTSGVITDETPEHTHSDPMHGGVATSYDGTNNHDISSFESTVENQQMSCAIWIHAPSLADDKKIWGGYKSGIGGFRIYQLNSSFWRFQWIKDIASGSGAGTLSFSFAAFPLSDGNWHRVFAVYDGTEWRVYFDGRLAGSLVSTLGGVTNTFSWGTAAGASSRAICELQGGTIWQNKVLTPQQVRDDALGLDTGVEPTDLWENDGEYLRSQTGGTDGTAVSSPASFANADVPRSPWDRDNYGRGYSLEGDASNYVATVANLNHDGIKTVTAEIDFRVLETPSNHYFARIDGNDPWAIRLYDTTTVRFIVRNGANSQLTHSVTVPAYDAGEFHKWKFEIVEDVDNPTTASFVRVTDLVTETVLGTSTGLDIGISSCTSNSNNVWLAVSAVASITRAKLSTDATVRVNVENVQDSVANNTGDMPLEEIGSPVVLALPRRIGSDLTSVGSLAPYLGPARRQAQNEGSSCIDPDGVNQYGIITNTFDFSGENWTLSGYVNFDVLGNAEDFLSQSGGEEWLQKNASDQWHTEIGVNKTFTAIDTVSTGVPYFYSFEKSGTTFTLSVTNKATGVTQSESATLTMLSVSADLEIARRNNSSNYINGKLYDLKLDHASGFHCPVVETSGSIAKDVSGTGKDIAWQNGPAYATQNDSHYSQQYGCSRSADFSPAVGGEGYIDTGLTGLDATKNINVKFAIEWPSGPINSMTLFGDSGNFGAITYFTKRIRFEWGGVIIASSNDATGKIFDGAVAGDIFEIEFDYDTVTGIGTLYSNTVEIGSGAMSPTVNTTAVQIGGGGLANQCLCTWHRFELTHDGVLLSKIDNMETRYDSVSDSILSLGGAESGLLTYPVIAALADGSEDVFGLAINAPAGTHHVRDGSTINHTPIANTQWPLRCWQDASFDGISSFITLLTAITEGNDFDVEFIFNGVTVTSESLIHIVNGANDRFAVDIISGVVRCTVYNGTHSGASSDSTLLAATDYLLRLVYTNATHNLDLYVDGDLQAGVTTCSTSGTAGKYLGQNTTPGNWFDGSKRNLKITAAGSLDADLSLAGNSLDRSSEVNHGADTDITFRKLTVANHNDGDLSVIPKSVDTNAIGQDKSIIHLTVGP